VDRDRLDAAVESLRAGRPPEADDGATLVLRRLAGLRPPPWPEDEARFVATLLPRRRGAPARAAPLLAALALAATLAALVPPPPPPFLVRASLGEAPPVPVEAPVRFAVHAALAQAPRLVLLHAFLEPATRTVVLTFRRVGGAPPPARAVAVERWTGGRAVAVPVDVEERGLLLRVRLPAPALPGVYAVEVPGVGRIVLVFRR
jgi:hypothetical protein